MRLRATIPVPGLSVSPTEPITAAGTRSQLLQLQTLVTVVLCYQLLFTPEVMLSLDAQRVTILGLMVLCGSLIILPDQLFLLGWFPAALALLDTAITTLLVYISGNASSELYLTYFVILLIATTARTRQQLFGFIAVVCTIYGMILYREYLDTGVLVEHHLLRIPLFLVMAIFYGGSAEQVRTLSEFDALTGLPNRRSFFKSVADGIHRKQGTDGQMGLLSVDLDGFKLINDTLGHSVGDRLLREVSMRFRRRLPPRACIARFGGDEFGVLIEPLGSREELAQHAETLLQELYAPIFIEGQEIYARASIGGAVYPDDADNPESLIKDADAALHKAKEQGRNTYEFFAPEINVKATERLTLETQFRGALERQELALYYQPQVDLFSGAIIGFEALLRWHHPELGLVSPGRFILIAEENGLIIPVGEWVLEEACRQIKVWQDGGLPALRITVNVSARQFRQPTFVESVQRVLQVSGVPPSLLELELTESSIMQDTDRNVGRLHELKLIGIRLALDDFGTGYSSLGYLQRFPIDTLKVDLTLVRDLATSKQAVAIVTAVTAMAQTLGLDVIAEGVETEAQMLRLREHGCRVGQGHFWGVPLAASETDTLLRDWPVLSRPRATQQQA